jgi:hypothetical protein
MNHNEKLKIKLRTYVDDNNCKQYKMAMNWDEHPIVPNSLPKMF